MTIIIIGLDNSGKTVLVEVFQRRKELRVLDPGLGLPWVPATNETIIPS